MALSVCFNVVNGFFENSAFGNDSVELFLQKFSLYG